MTPTTVDPVPACRVGRRDPAVPAGSPPFP